MGATSAHDAQLVEALASSCAPSGAICERRGGPRSLRARFTNTGATRNYDDARRSFKRVVCQTVMQAEIAALEMNDV